MDLVPTIDISRPDAASREALDVACRDHGFFLLEGHGQDALIERTWEQTRRFFGGPRARKQAVLRSEDNALGYYDRELTKRKRDCKEVFDFMQPESPYGSLRNRWPEQEGFRETLAAFYDAFGKLAEETLALVHEALGLAPSELAPRQGALMTSTVRLNHYPVGDPVPAEERAPLAPLAEVALGHHTDPGVITLLLQDATGGLQTLSKEHGWIDVPPSPGTIVVNLGDSVQVWSNDRYRAAVHRVVPMTREARYSIPFFFNPALDAVIEPAPSLCEPAAVYWPFEWREFIQARMDDNYADVGDEDTQISRFRVAS